MSYAIDDMSAEDLIKRHLATLGTPEALEAAKNRVIEGKANARVTQASITEVNGVSMLASTTDKRMMKLNFQTIGDLDYDKEILSFDGEKVIAPFLTSASRSALGDFVYEYKEIMRSGLMGGTLFSSWALRRHSTVLSKLSFAGKEKLNNREVYVLRCVPKGGSSLNIKMYFDAVTFDHLRTRYKYSLAPYSGVSAEATGRQRETTYDLVEEFSDFRQVEGLRLPLNYKITYTYDNDVRNRQFEWMLRFSKFSFGSAISDDKFRVE